MAVITVESEAGARPSAESEERPKHVQVLASNSASLRRRVLVSPLTRRWAGPAASDSTVISGPRAAS